MAFNPKSALSFLLIFNILLAITNHAVFAGREIPTDSKNTDMKQPDSFIGKDGSVLVPGIGRFMLPPLGHGFDPFTYNPVTGTNGGFGSDTGTGAGTGGSSVPGGDDTLVPNPGVQVPNPGSGIGGNTPGAAAARP
ncbi:hypothetical protein ACSBR2_027520 [Camellia fascicularis]